MAEPTGDEVLSEEIRARLDVMVEASLEARLWAVTDLDLCEYVPRSDADGEDDDG